MKKGIEEISNELLTITSLNPVFYRWKTENGTSTLKSGFIAQEVQKILPELVSTGKWIDGSDKLFLNIGGMLPYVVGAIGEQQRTLDELLSTGTSTMGTTSPFYHLFDGKEDTVWEKLVRLVDNFVDGILKVAGIETTIVYTKDLEAENIKTNILCIGSICIDEDQLKELLTDASQTTVTFIDDGAGTIAIVEGDESPNDGSDHLATGTTTEDTTTNQASGDDTSGQADPEDPASNGSNNEENTESEPSSGETPVSPDDGVTEDPTLTAEPTYQSSGEDDTDQTEPVVEESSSEVVEPIPEPELEPEPAIDNPESA